MPTTLRPARPLPPSRPRPPSDAVVPSTASAATLDTSGLGPSPPSTAALSFAAAFYHDARACTGPRERTELHRNYRDKILAVEKLAANLAATFVPLLHADERAGHTTADTRRWTELVELARRAPNQRDREGQRLRHQTAVVATWGPDVFSHYGWHQLPSDLGRRLHDLALLMPNWHDVVHVLNSRLLARHESRVLRGRNLEYRIGEHSTSSSVQDPRSPVERKDILSALEWARQKAQSPEACREIRIATRKINGTPIKRFGLQHDAYGMVVPSQPPSDDSFALSSAVSSADNLSPSPPPPTVSKQAKPPSAQPLPPSRTATEELDWGTHDGDGGSDGDSEQARDVEDEQPLIVASALSPTADGESAAHHELARWRACNDSGVSPRSPVSGTAVAPPDKSHRLETSDDDLGAGDGSDETQHQEDQGRRRTLRPRVMAGKRKRASAESSDTSPQENNSLGGSRSTAKTRKLSKASASPRSSSLESQRSAIAPASAEESDVQTPTSEHENATADQMHVVVEDDVDSLDQVDDDNDDDDADTDTDTQATEDSASLENGPLHKAGDAAHWKSRQIRQSGGKQLSDSGERVEHEDVDEDAEVAVEKTAEHENEHGLNASIDVDIEEDVEDESDEVFEVESEEDVEVESEDVEEPSEEEIDQEDGLEAGEVEDEEAQAGYDRTSGAQDMADSLPHRGAQGEQDQQIAADTAVDHQTEATGQGGKNHETEDVSIPAAIGEDANAMELGEIEGRVQVVSAMLDSDRDDGDANETESYEDTEHEKMRSGKSTEPSTTSSLTKSPRPEQVNEGQNGMAVDTHSDDNEANSHAESARSGVGDRSVNNADSDQTSDASRGASPLYGASRSGRDASQSSVDRIAMTPGLEDARNAEDKAEARRAERLGARTGAGASKDEVESSPGTLLDTLESRHASIIEQLLREASEPASTTTDHQDQRKLRSDWLHPTRWASIYAEPEDELGRSSAAAEQADVWYLSSDAFRKYSDLGYIFDRPVVIKQNFQDSGMYDLEEYMVMLWQRFADQDIDVQNSQTGVCSSMSIAEYCAAISKLDLASSDSIAHVGNALNLGRIARADEPLLTRLPRFRLLSTLVDHANGIVGKKVAGKCIDVESSLHFNLLGLTGAFSRSHVDSMIGTWVRCLFGRKVWMIATGMQEDDWQRFARDGCNWSPEGKGRIVVLEQDDVLLMPPGLRVAHAVFTPETCLMEGGVLWDDCTIPEILDGLVWIAKNQVCTNEAISYQLPEVVDALEHVVEQRRTGPTGEGAEDPEYLNSIKEGIKALRALGCACSSECKSPTQCPCIREARRCTAWCLQHPPMHPELAHVAGHSLGGNGSKRQEPSRFSCMEE